MLIRYWDYVDRADGVAVLGATADGRARANEEGRELLERSADAFRQGFAAAANERVVVMREIGGRTLAFVPLFGEDGLDGVLATSADLRELPGLLHELHSPAPDFSNLSIDARAALERARRRVGLLADVGRALNGACEPREVARDLVRLLAAWSGGRAVVELRDADERVAVAAQPHEGRVLVASIAAVLARRGALEQVGVPGLRAVALSGRGRASGFVAVVVPSAYADAEEDDLLLRDIAERTTTALEYMLARRREHDVATGLHSAMLPIVLPRVPGVAFDVAYAPADGEMPVGGDWYDAFLLRDGRVAIAIGDVAETGLDAAIVMANVRRTIRSAALERCGAAATLGLANIVTCLAGCPMVTAFFGILDPLTQRLEYACAGHPPPILVDANAALTVLALDGPPLGVAEEALLETHAIDLPETSALVLYTDGVLEAGHDPIGGERILHDALRAWAASRFSESAEMLQGRIVGSEARSDDAAMLILRRVPVDELELAFPATFADSHRARLAVQRYARDSALGEQRAADFTLAVAEAMNNAAEHAYERHEGMVRARVRIAAGRAVAVVEDDGRWREQSTPDRGRGIAMIRALADECDLVHGEHGTKVTLVMHLPLSDAAAYSA